MKMTKIALAVASCALLGACSSWQPREDGPTYRVGPQYTGKGYVSGVSAFVYGDRTLLQYKHAPLTLTVKDAKGNSVGYEKGDGFYRLDRQLDQFTARANFLQVTDFKIHPIRKAPANPSADAPKPAQVTASIVTRGPESRPPVQLSNQTHDDLVQLLKTSKAQLEEVQAAVHQGTADRATIERLNAKLDAIQHQLSSGTVALYIQHFEPRKTNFAPPKEVADFLVAVAKAADQIKVRGRTDSNMAGVTDKTVADARAASARAFLVAHGVDPKKISISSQGAGDHIAPNNTQQGRDINRRVEVELLMSTKKPVAPNIAAKPAAASTYKMTIKVRKGSLYENLNELSDRYGWNRPRWNIDTDWLLPDDSELLCNDFSGCMAQLLEAHPLEAEISRFDRVIYVKREVR